MSKKLITIIISTYNASKTIKNCLDSIEDQKNENCELIVIDGKSSDNTIEIIKSYGSLVDKLISESDNGVYDAWNKGINISDGEWIMFLGADDILLKSSIDTYLSIIKNNTKIKSIDYICANNEYTDKQGNIVKILGDKPNYKKMSSRMVAAHVGSLHSKERLFGQVGLYNLDFKICADYELLLRKKNKLNFIFISKKIARMSTGGMSFTSDAVYETFKIRKLHSTISPFRNILVLFYDLLTFYSFFYRK